MPEPTSPSIDEIIVRGSSILGGESAFRGTRVAVATISEHSEAGLPLGEVLGSWPMLDRDDVVAVLRAAHRRVLDRAA
jgi:uncharacterized protein (DUF433 family)